MAKTANPYADWDFAKTFADFKMPTFDIEALLAAADELGRRPLVIAKIERFEAIQNIDAILQAADGLMVARGDLGVEIPIARMAVVQKRLMNKANRLGKPVITAT